MKYQFYDVNDFFIIVLISEIYKNLPISKAKIQRNENCSESENGIQLALLERESYLLWQSYSQYNTPLLAFKEI